MTEIEITKVMCVWQVWIGGNLRISCQSREQAERVALKAALLQSGELLMEDL